MKTIAQLQQELEAAKTLYANTIGNEYIALVTHYREARAMAARAVSQISVTFNDLSTSTYTKLRDIDLIYMCKARCMVQILEADPDFMATLSQADELEASVHRAGEEYLNAVRAEEEAARARKEARATAEKEALAKIEAEYADVAEPEATAPFRGRGIKPAQISC